MFFNGNKLTGRKPKENRKYEFTDKLCREFDAEEHDGITTISDKLCKNLRMYVSQNNNHSFAYQGLETAKVIGSVYQMTVKEAREIVNNIRENKEEFKREVSNIKLPLAAYFKKFGKFPHQPKGTEVIISNENASLKEKIKDLQAEVDKLQSQVQMLIQDNRKYHSRLTTIKNIVGEIDDDISFFLEDGE